MKDVATVLQIIGANMDTLVLIVFFMMLVFYLLRLHLSPKYENFDLAQLVTRRDGSVDFEKLRVMVAFIAGTYAFFYLLSHDKAAFGNYGQWFLVITFGHAIGNRMTSGKESQSQSQPQS